MKVVWALAICTIVTIDLIAADDGRLISLNFRDAPLCQVVPFYEVLTEQKVAVEPATYSGLTLRPDTRLTTAEVTYRSSTHAFMIDADEFLVTVTDDTFTNTPAWSPEWKTSPPLSEHAAYAIAAERLRSYVANPGDYSLAEIALQRFFDTDWWYYVVRFEYPEWREKEPYRTLIEDGQWANTRPVIDITIRMDGLVVESDGWLNQRK